MANTAPNAKTRQVMVGSVALGGGVSCVVQSMLNLPLADVKGNLSQISRLQEAGCEVVPLPFLIRPIWISSRRSAKSLLCQLLQIFISALSLP